MDFDNFLTLLSKSTIIYIKRKYIICSIKFISTRLKNILIKLIIFLFY